MPKKKWLQSEEIRVTVTLIPPPEIRCLIPSLDRGLFKLRLVDDQGRQLDPRWLISDRIADADTSWRTVSVHRGLLSRLTFTVPINRPAPPDSFLYEVKPGRYRLSAVYDARNVRRALEKDPAEPFGEALRWCAERARLMSGGPAFTACWTLLDAVLERTTCPPREGTFFEGPYESNVVEFKVVPGKRKDAEDGS
jgi:hypothetical protein